VRGKSRHRGRHGIVRGCLPQEEARFGARRTMPVRRLVKAGLVGVVRAYPVPFVNDIDVSWVGFLRRECLGRGAGGAPGAPGHVPAPGGRDYYHDDGASPLF
jgi:hypothetical protein